jgi:hypothetical protein
MTTEDNKMSENEAKWRRGLLGDLNKHSSCVDRQNEEPASPAWNPKCSGT